MCSINRRRAATFWRGQTFTAGDVYVGSHLRFDLPHRQKRFDLPHRQKQGAAEQDLQFVSPRNAERTKSRAGWRSLG
jgi:hypothetical protein